MRTNTKPLHVVPRKNGWAIKREGAKRATRVAPTKGIGTQYAKEISSKKSPVFLHNLDGTISEVFTPRTQKKSSATILRKATKQRVHVLAREDDWAVKKENNQVPSKTFKKKYQAIRYAHKLADKSKAAMVVHRADGKINHIDIPPHFNSIIADAIHLR